MKLTAYRLNNAPFTIEPANRQREWMDKAPFSYRCLPMTVANQMGWVIPAPCDFSFSWDGRESIDAVKVTVSDPGLKGYITSHFGFGILTFSLPFLFQTEPGYGLIVRGATNYVIPSVQPLDGFVETEWSPSTFTMNWLITDKNMLISVEKGEPICMILPYQLAPLEQFEPEIEPIENNPELHAAFQKWANSRSQFNARPDRQPHEWQKDYFQAMQLPKLHVKPFFDRKGRANGKEDKTNTDR